ncbi:formate dehydrogenase subunit gamma [Oceanicoccus sagamiensis]|uniref:NADH-quinone oxidoreductase subunit E n=1 Tax=Oceanicoccus sagamiensis TaxID=716816 RepID=A0A1X9NQ60_9GAMM|nr:formate dehydrogenase subunit gamma [Oceanicoccus sagamiensis]ARN75973.1 formate dehydrogenase subunit gamma [Oceanicoccus sagamiensis]
MLENNAALDSGEIRSIVTQYQHKPGALLPILHAIQDKLGYIPPDSLPLIAEALHLSRAEVHGVVSFYHYFRSAPAGNHVVQICRAESCQAMGSRALESYAKASLKIDYHQTTADGEITLEPVYCLGNCACSPSVRVGQDVIGNMDNKKFEQLLSELTTQKVAVQ